MNYRLFEILVIIFSIYFFYAAYKGYPSLIGNYLGFFGYKKRMKFLDRFHNVFIAVWLIVIAVALEVKYQNNVAKQEPFYKVTIKG